MISKQMQTQVQNSSVIRAMFEEGKRLSAIYGEENVYDFSLGNPSVDPPGEVKTAIFDILNNEGNGSVHGYMNNSGHETVRDAIAHSINARFNTSFSQNNIIMTVGAAGGLNVILKTLLDPQDEVIVFAPFFGEYKNYVSNYNGNLIVIPADTASFQPNLELFKDKITARTKAVIINSPNNPTGV
ncbi:MAG TPA: aminotransferase class I/II-fold pyridoxal phosphate-dependent enzyme, partial [Syntrophomonas sp.]|nr:aminotransferase class I/II-fold pyridoxal phosphate-dependent enzyme [Syntrophomonas sp.]